MAISIKAIIEQTVFQGIENHLAWQTVVCGLEAEKMLRGKKTPYLYILREGEKSNAGNVRNYYITFILPDMSIKHQPIIVTIDDDEWYCEQGGGYGPMPSVTGIDDILHLLMHAPKDAPKPFIS